MARLQLRWRPGQHLYLRFMALGVHGLTTHPFAVCSIPEGDSSCLVFHTKPRGGITGWLANMARKQPGITVPLFVEGPYGGVPRRWDEGFDKTIVIAGSAGAGFSVGLVEDWLCRERNGNSKNSNRNSLQVVVSSRDPGMRRWFIDTINRLAEKYASTGRLQDVHIALHKTGQRVGPDPSQYEKKQEGIVHEPAIDISFKLEQADLPSIIREAERKASHIGVAVCGPSSMAHDVATACGAEQRQTPQGREGAVEVWLHQEAFTN
ncbi:ferric reductase transmembrane [Ophiostoma piceae UAMH 11346]|uniref:ferric-chelate reductase (NADPH) n=1 Tax=Ophiostoma piceae (strain UAMH 11346) TaxID=1262450 RepID=S3BQ33_OPHP1|nr:ferric reductase transmembrane [Ophiostoma piceae UAMH 11346]